MAVKKTSARRGRERRASERADARLSMRVDAAAMAGATRIVTESQNISGSGVYCHASNYLAPLSKVQLTIVLPKSPGGAGGPQELVKCDGIVVRCNQRPGGRSETPYDLACMFTSLEGWLRTRIEEFVTWRNLQSLRAALAETPASERRKGVRVVAGARVAAKKKATARPAAKKRAGARTTASVKAARPASKAARKSSAPRAGRSGR
jgi:hypothetical protein